MDVTNIKKFDTQCKYIKTWIPELSHVPNKDLYIWNQDIYNKWKLHVPPMLDLQNRNQEWCSITK